MKKNNIITAICVLVVMVITAIPGCSVASSMICVAIAGVMAHNMRLSDIKKDTLINKH